MDFQELATDRLALVHIETHHTESFFEIMSRDEVTKYYGMSSITEIGQAENIIESFRQTFESGRGIRWSRPRGHRPAHPAAAQRRHAGRQGPGSGRAMSSIGEVSSLSRPHF